VIEENEIPSCSNTAIVESVKGDFMSIKKFLMAASLAAIGALIGTGSSHAAGFPSRPITIQVAYPAGGTTDREIRVLADLVSKEIGQPVIVENKPGAGGTIAASSLAAAGKADGYTLAQAPVTLFRMPHIQKVAWGPLRDFTYVTGLSGYVLGVAVPAASPFKTWEDVVRYARANPGMVSYCSVGIGSTQHLGMADIEKKTGLKFNHIPYKGGAETTRAILASEVMQSADALSTLTVLGDKVRILMVWEPQRYPELPDVPTARELGIDIVYQSPYGLVGPKGIPRDVVNKLYRIFQKALNDPKHTAVLKSIKQTAWQRSPEEYERYATQAFETERKLLDNAELLTN
jgi:tripartite-type tricarboxylate transporter receptor subunit TctC